MMGLGYMNRLSIRLPYLVEILDYTPRKAYFLLVVLDIAEKSWLLDWYSITIPESQLNGG